MYKWLGISAAAALVVLALLAITGVERPSSIAYGQAASNAPAVVVHQSVAQDGTQTFWGTVETGSACDSVSARLLSAGGDTVNLELGLLPATPCSDTGPGEQPFSISIKNPGHTMMLVGVHFSGAPLPFSVS